MHPKPFRSKFPAYPMRCFDGHRQDIHRAASWHLSLQFAYEKLYDMLELPAEITDNLVEINEFNYPELDMIDAILGTEYSLELEK